MNTNVIVYQGDITEADKEYMLNNVEFIGVDTETTGLDPCKDELCLIQIYTPLKVFVVHFDRNINAINIKAILESKKITKIFHHATFDVRFLMNHLNTYEIRNISCTKIAAKLMQGANEKNSLKDLLYKYLGIVIDKKQQMSDWSTKKLTEDQLEYAIGDVKYLIMLYEILMEKLKERGLYEYAQKCYEFLPTQAYLLNNGIEDIFKY